MKPFRIAAIVLIIGTGLVGSYFIIKTPASDVIAEKSDNNSNSGTEEPATPKIPIEWIDKISSSVQGNIPDESFPSSTEPDRTQNINDQLSSNLTAFVAQSLFNQMRVTDQNGQQPFRNFNPNDPQAQALIAEAAATVNPSKLFDQSIQDSALKISTDNSKENKANYIQTVFNVFLDGIKDLPKKPSNVIDEAILSGNVSDAQNFANAYQGVVLRTADTPVPSDWIVLHKSYVNSLKRAEMIFEAAADYKNDPIKASAVLQAAPQIFDEVVRIQKEYLSKVAEINN